MDLELRAGVLSVSVYLRAEQPGCGHGLAALTAAIKAARSMGAQRILAEMEEENAASIRRCTRVGMTLRPDRNKHNDLVFELDLTSSWPTPPRSSAVLLDLDPSS